MSSHLHNTEPGDTADRGDQPRRTVPADVPAASTSGAVRPPVSGTRSDLAAGNPSPPVGGVGSLRSRTGKLAILALRASMPERDLAVLRSVASHRFLTTKHITALHFNDTTQDQYGSRMARKVLRRLDQSSVVTHLEQRVGGVRAGSDGYIWRVGPVGDRLLRFGTEDSTRRARRYEPSTWFLQHCLAIADAHVTLLHAARAKQFDLLSVDLEPATWREYPGAFSERRVIKPDLSVITANGEYEDHFWIEVDLGNEHLPTILDKCRTYETYRHTGLEDAHRGEGVFPVVVWVMHSAERAEKLQTAIAAARNLDASLFRVTTMAELSALVAGGAA